MALTQAQLDAAIEDIVEGRHQSYSIGDRSVTKLDPEMLLRVIKQLEKRQAGGPRAQVAKLRRPKL